MTTGPVLILTDGTTIIDLLGPDSGWTLADPYWNPRIATYKSDGFKVNASTAEGQRLVSKEYDNVIETIPLVLRGLDQNRAMQTINELLALGRQAADYWAENYEYSDVWLEARPACADCYTGYARIVQMHVPELTNPYGQPFFGGGSEAAMEGLSLVIEREPLWRATPPGEMIGPLFNLIDNPDFELWNFGLLDSQPNNWTDLETVGITGTNNQQAAAVHSGSYALKINVTTSNQLNRAKGVTQIVADIRPNTTYTVVVWARSDGIINGVGRVLVTYAGQLEVYRSSAAHGWTLYTGVFTTMSSDVVAITLEILTTSTSQCRGAVYFDSLLLLEGDWEQEAIDGVLPYMSGSHIINHWDQRDGAFVAGHVNYLDVWNVPGNEDALVRLEMQNNTTPAAPGTAASEVYATIRAGMRRTGDVLNFDNYHDPPGVPDATASGSNKINLPALSRDWTYVTNQVIADNVQDNLGRFRVLARVYDGAPGTANMEVNLQYFIGAPDVGNKALASARAPIRGDWSVVNLTANAAVNFSQKFSNDIPNQLGYIVQAKRPTGVSGMALDYVLTMPTDGGYIEASLEEALTYGNALIADNTDLFSVEATNQRAGWRHVYTAVFDGTSRFSLFPYGNALYIGGQKRLYRLKNGLAELLYNPPAGALQGTGAMAEYNGSLFFSFDAVGASVVYEARTAFPGAIQVTTAGAQIYAMKAFKNKLYIATSDDGVWTWNGTTATKIYSYAVNGFGAIEIYRNHLFFGSIVGVLFEYDPDAGTWTNLGSPTTSGGALTRIYSLKEMGGKLYAGGTIAGLPAGVVAVYDGLTYGPGYVSDTGCVSIQAMDILDNTLYAGGLSAANGTAVVVSTQDGTTWDNVYDTSQYAVQAMAAYAGRLYILTNNAVSNDGILYALGIRDNTYKATSWSGSPFVSPPRKRHRFVFSYDRENYVNNMNDEMLIGVGFVPRYLALRGKS